MQHRILVTFSPVRVRVLLRESHRDYPRVFLLSASVTKGALSLRATGRQEEEEAEHPIGIWGMSGVRLILLA